MRFGLRLAGMDLPSAVFSELWTQVNGPSATADEFGVDFV